MYRQKLQLRLRSSLLIPPVGLRAAFHIIQQERLTIKSQPLKNEWR